MHFSSFEGVSFDFADVPVTTGFLESDEVYEGEKVDGECFLLVGDFYGA